MTSWISREVDLPARDLALGLRAAAAEEPVEAPVGHGVPAEEAEVAHVHPERSVRAQIEQIVEDALRVARLAVGGQAHELVLARVDPEPAEVREGRVQQPERVREEELALELDPVSPATPMLLVAHSPTPSKVRIAADSNGDG